VNRAQRRAAERRKVQPSPAPAPKPPQRPASPCELAAARQRIAEVLAPYEPIEILSWLLIASSQEARSYAGQLEHGSPSQVCRQPRFNRRSTLAFSARISRCSRSVRQSGQITPTTSPSSDSCDGGDSNRRPPGSDPRSSALEFGAVAGSLCRAAPDERSKICPHFARVLGNSITRRARRDETRPANRKGASAPPRTRAARGSARASRARPRSRRLAANASSAMSI
jgi:hypothetical protein